MKLKCRAKMKHPALRLLRKQKRRFTKARRHLPAKTKKKLRGLKKRAAPANFLKKSFNRLTKR